MSVELTKLLKLHLLIKIVKFCHCHVQRSRYLQVKLKIWAKIFAHQNMSFRAFRNSLATRTSNDCGQYAVGHSDVHVARYQAKASNYTKYTRIVLC